MNQISNEHNLEERIKPRSFKETLLRSVIAGLTVGVISTALHFGLNYNSEKPNEELRNPTPIVEVQDPHKYVVPKPKSSNPHHYIPEKVN